MKERHGQQLTNYLALDSQFLLCALSICQWYWACDGPTHDLTGSLEMPPKLPKTNKRLKQVYSTLFAVRLQLDLYNTPIHDPTGPIEMPNLQSCRKYIKGSNRSAVPSRQCELFLSKWSHWTINAIYHTSWNGYKSTFREEVLCNHHSLYPCHGQQYQIFDKSAVMIWMLMMMTTLMTITVITTTMTATTTMTLITTMWHQSDQQNENENFEIDKIDGVSGVSVGWWWCWCW